MTQLDRARTRVIAVSDELVPEAKKLFVDLPAAVYNQRTAEHARNGKVIAELGLLIARMKSERATGVTDETIAKLRELRIAYHATCRTDCTRGVVFAAITKQLFWAYVARGDSAAAMAESKLLDHLDPTAQQEIATKQSEQIIKAMGRTHRVASAREQGIDADTASSTANGKLLDLGDGRYVYEWKDDFKIYYEALVPDGTEVGHVGGKVAALEKKGAQHPGPVPRRILVGYRGYRLLRIEPDRWHRLLRQADLSPGMSRLGHARAAAQSRSHHDSRERSRCAARR